jgi:hypothetical protein
MPTAIAVTPNTTTPGGTCNSSGSVVAPSGVASYRLRTMGNARPNRSTPAAMPSTTARPSRRPVAAETHDVPGHNPPITKPAPNTMPPIACGAMYVPGTTTRVRSRSPTLLNQNSPSMAVTIALNITFRTVMSVR